ncbi:glycoside hydrolase family 127 protein [Fulvivirga ligni]|uniref:glycoside hydrolase family 127 protein n=1 Tax=Fulvivirga ligni TaxID=2904246 RepID=UPI001F24572D|nr:glycoside hydrolase family 127 protein [Fulvivirga ligni]UII19583.1 glycoside hydrolase family 127 protein [Fulvivirga ligni]
MNRYTYTFLIAALCLIFDSLSAQNRTELFPLSDVQLLDGPFKHAQDLNVKTLLEYDVDRLLHPFLEEAGLKPKAAGFENWSGLDGHVGGHYLSAMAIHYASTDNEACLQRMNYMLDELERCQKQNAISHPEWGKGYVGGVPNSEGIWSRVKKGEVAAVWDYWVPWYNVHKIYAGLRDAWFYGKSEKAKVVFLQLCDWGIALTENLSDEDMERMLANEHGGMNESYADAYAITGDKKYLTAARRFSHKMLLNAMAEGKDNLDNLHANTQVPKVVGFQRIAQESGDEKYAAASEFFWKDVTGERSIAIGGNSRREFFPPASNTIDFINMVEGPESCNTNNMLKLTKDLYESDHQVKYVDFYERALYNHILSTQHPVHGGYVYFTSARPRHYRVYSAPNQAMWCCVGTGMENHGKYGEFIYAHQDNKLFINLFIASELSWKEKGITLKQETSFPDQETTTLTITKGSADFDMQIRYPSWVSDGQIQVVVNGKTIAVKAKPGHFISIARKWKKGDQVKLTLPMHTTMEPLINLPDYVAFLHGPIVLGAKTGSEDLAGLVAGAGRWEHIAHGEQLPVTEAPIIVEDDKSGVVNEIKPVQGADLEFTTANLNLANVSSALTLEPFFRIHDSRYMMYWMVTSKEGYTAMQDSLAVLEAERLALEKRTLDMIIPGQQQPEVDHGLKTENSEKGVHLDQFWRDAKNGGYFSYELDTQGETALALRVLYWGNERGERHFDILIDNEKLASEDLSAKWNAEEFKPVEYRIPAGMLEGKKRITVKFKADKNAVAGGVFGVRLVRQDKG